MLEKSCPTDSSLPLCYMSDYSVLGLWVGRFEEAVRILEENAFSVIRESDRSEIIVDDAAHVRKVFQIFERHSIDYEIADTIDQVYQG